MTNLPIVEEKQSTLASDGRPLDYQDDQGVQWIMAACGHRVGGAVKLGDKVLLCPNCRFLVRFQSIKVVYPERMPALEDGAK